MAEALIERTTKQNSVVKLIGQHQEKYFFQFYDFMFRLETSEIDELLSIFNVSASGSLKKDEFKFCWSEWIKKVAR